MTVGREVPMSAPKREAEANIKKLVFFCDREPRYPFTDQFSPRYPKGNVARKNTGGTPDACIQTFSRTRPDKVPAMVTLATIRRADFSGWCLKPRTSRPSRAIQARRVVIPSTFPVAGPAGKPAVRAYNATDPATMAAATGIAMSTRFFREPYSVLPAVYYALV